MFQKLLDKYAKPFSNTANRLLELSNVSKRCLRYLVTPEYRGHGSGWQYNKMTVLTTLGSRAETCNQEEKAQGWVIFQRRRSDVLSGVGKHGHSNSPRLLYGWYSGGLLLAGDPQHKITSGSYLPSRSVQRRTATRNSCAKLASISLTFSLTVNPFLLSSVTVFSPFNCSVTPPPSFFFCFFF